MTHKSLRKIPNNVGGRCNGEVRVNNTIYLIEHYKFSNKKSEIYTKSAAKNIILIKFHV